MTEWIAAVCAILSLAGAAFSWWRSELSSRAKRNAQEAAEHADSTLSEIRRQSVAIEAIAGLLKPAPLMFEHDSGVLWRLRNTTGAEIAIEVVENEGEFLRKPFGLLPLVIPPQGATGVTLIAVDEFPLPATLELRIRGRSDVLRIPVPTVA